MSCSQSAPAIACARPTGYSLKVPSRPTGDSQHLHVPGYAPRQLRSSTAPRHANREWMDGLATAPSDVNQRCKSSTSAIIGWPKTTAHYRVSIDRHPRSTMTPDRSEEHTSELQSLMRNSYAVFCLKKKKKVDYHSR